MEQLARAGLGYSESHNDPTYNLYDSVFSMLLDEKEKELLKQQMCKAAFSDSGLEASEIFLRVQGIYELACKFVIVEKSPSRKNPHYSSDAFDLRGFVNVSGWSLKPMDAVYVLRMSLIIYYVCCLNINFRESLLLRYGFLRAMNDQYVSGKSQPDSLSWPTLWAQNYGAPLIKDMGDYLNFVEVDVRNLSHPKLRHWSTIHDSAARGS